MIAGFAIIAISNVLELVAAVSDSAYPMDA